MILVIAVDNKINHSTFPIGNENSVAFFVSDNAGIPKLLAHYLKKRWNNIPNFDYK